MQEPSSMNIKFALISSDIAIEAWQKGFSWLNTELGLTIWKALGSLALEFMDYNLSTKACGIVEYIKVWKI